MIISPPVHRQLWMWMWKETCALDTDRKKASRPPHLVAPMLNSSLVLPAIAPKARGVQRPSHWDGEDESGLCVFASHIWTICAVYCLFFLPVPVICFGRRSVGRRDATHPFILVGSETVALSVWH